MSTQLQTPCDEASALSRKGRIVAHPGWTIAATMLASGLAFIDGSVTNVALPVIGRDLGGTGASLSWTINAYLLPLAALLLLGGAAGDQFGRRRMLVFGITVFALASVGCAWAPSLSVLQGLRALQGLGAAILMPNSLGILGGSFEGEARGRAVGTWAATGAIASAIGPPIGGWLVSAVGWRAIFYLNLPVAVAALVIAFRYVEETQARKQALDWLGAGLATVALGAMTLGLTSWSTERGVTAVSAACLLLGAALLLFFVLNERRLGDHAMMPLALFASTPSVGLTLMTFLLYGALGGLVVLLPYVLITAGRYTPLQAGLALLPFSIVIGGASRLTGRLTARFGPRWPLSVGPIVAGLGLLLMTRLDPQRGYWTTVAPGMVVIAFGMAGAVAPLTTAVLASVDEQHAGTASGFNSAIARTGGLVATALSGGVMALSGPALVSAFHLTAWAGGAVALLSGAIAFVTLRQTVASRKR